MKEEEEGVGQGLTAVQDFDVVLKTMMMVFQEHTGPPGT